MGKEVRIFFDCHSFDTGRQGTTTYLGGVLNALPAVAARLAPDIDLKLICAAQDEARVRSQVNVEFDFVPIRTGFVRSNLRDIPVALRRTGADLAVSQYVRPFISPCPTMSIIHDVLFLDYPESFSWSYRAIRKQMFRWSAHRSTFLSTVSRYSAERISANFGIPMSDILIIPNAVDREFRFAARKGLLEFPTTPVRLLSVSRLERRKRHEWGIYAMDALAEDGIKSELTIVGGGDGVYAEDLRNAIEEARMKRGLQISTKSDLSVADLIAEYVRADIFLFPAEAEGFGIPVIEAAAVGTPCVISTGGALAEFEDHFCGVSFPSDDLEAFITGIRSVTTNLPKFREGALANRQHVSETYTWEAAAEGYVNVIRHLEAATT